MVGSNLAKVLEDVGETWHEGIEYPAWVVLEECALDQFYTSPDTAQACFSQLMKFLRKRNIGEDDCLFIEPSAGDGSFSAILPEGSVVMDIAPAGNGIIQRDFLTWEAQEDPAIKAAHAQGKTIVVVGNPPFGARGWLALSFLNKCATFADYCAFLLPMSFASEGKGSPRYRVQEMRSAYIDELLKEIFSLPGGAARKFNVIWQIWEKGENKRPVFDNVDRKFVTKTIGDFSYRLCGQEFKDEADIFISQAFYPNAGMKISKNWDDILYGSGYGVKANDPADVEKMIKVLREADWMHFSTASTHGCRHVGVTEIKKVLAQEF